MLEHGPKRVALLQKDRLLVPLTVEKILRLVDAAAGNGRCILGTEGENAGVRDHGRLEPVFADRLKHGMDLFARTFGRRAVFDDLFGAETRNVVERVGQPAERRASVRQRGDLVDGRRKGIVLFRFGRGFVRHVRQTDARGALADAEMPQTVDDPAGFVQKEKIAVASHQLDDEPQLHLVHEFVAPGEGEDRDAVQSLLFDRNDATADQVFPEQHAERGRGFRVFEILCDRLDASVFRMDTEHQLHAACVRRVNVQNDDIFIGLLHLVDLSADKVLKFPYASV